MVHNKWKYIHYKEGHEELYNIVEDPNEWYNVTGYKLYNTVVKELRNAAPSVFAPTGTSKNNLKLVVEGDIFHWEKKMK